MYFVHVAKVQLKDCYLMAKFLSNTYPQVIT